MRICILSAQFPPQRCGVGDYTYFLACALAATGHDVDVVTAVGELDPSLYPLPHNVHVHRTVETWSVRGLPGILKSISRLNPDVLVIQYAPTAFAPRGIPLAISLLPVLVRASSRVRVIANCHELYAGFDASVRQMFRAVWQRMALLPLAAGSHCLSVTSSGWRQGLRRVGIIKRTALVPVGSNIPFVAVSAQDRAHLRRQLLDGQDGILLAGMGAKHDRDLPRVLHALRRLKELGPAKLVWIGGGTPIRLYRLAIDSAIRDNGLGDGDILWTGQLPHPDVSRLLSACDMMVLPFVDGISTRRTSALAALQHGLPLITTYGSASEPWFVHDRNAYLVPVGDSQALAVGILELARRPELRARLAQGGRALYDAHFTWELIARLVTNLALTVSGQLDLVGALQSGGAATDD